MANEISENRTGKLDCCVCQSPLCILTDAGDERAIAMPAHAVIATGLSQIGAVIVSQVGELDPYLKGGHHACRRIRLI